MYAVDEGPYYTEKSTFALNGLREKTEVILAAAPRGCVSGSSVRRARPSSVPFLLSTFVSPRQFRLTMHRVSRLLLHPHIYRALSIFLLEFLRCNL